MMWLGIIRNLGINTQSRDHLGISLPFLGSPINIKPANQKLFVSLFTALLREAALWPLALGWPHGGVTSCANQITCQTPPPACLHMYMPAGALQARLHYAISRLPYMQVAYNLHAVFTIVSCV